VNCSSPRRAPGAMSTCAQAACATRVHGESTFRGLQRVGLYVSANRFARMLAGRGGVQGVNITAGSCERLRWTTAWPAGRLAASSSPILKRGKRNSDNGLGDGASARSHARPRAGAAQASGKLRTAGARLPVQRSRMRSRRPCGTPGPRPRSPRLARDG